MFKGILVITIFLLFLLAFGGFLGGFALLADPTGAMVGFPDDMIDRLPVSTYMWPAVFLVVVFGLAPAYTGLRLSRSFFAEIDFKSTIVSVIGISVILIGWMSVQLWLLGWGHTLQTVTAIHSLLLLLSGLCLYRMDQIIKDR